MKEIQLEEMWGKINKALTSENKTFLESKTAKILPNNPTSQGFSADQIRKSLYEGILVLFEWLKTTNNSNVDFNNKVMETLTAITENNEEDKQDLANLKQALIDGTFNVKYLTWAIMATNDENGNRIIDTYATIERLTQVLEALTQEISDRKAADDLEKKERKEETSAIINSVNQEISDRTNAVSVLNNLLTAETENRTSEDEKVLQYAQSVNEALVNAKTDLQGKIDSEAQTRLTSDNEIKASITSKEDSLKALINSVKNELNGYITTLNNRVNNLPTNYVFDTYESMTSDLLNASNTKYKVGDTLFIKEVNKPDYWVSAILSTKGTYGYYELSIQESKVDLSNYVKISELSREAIEEKFLETLENGITKSFASSSFTATDRNSGIDINNYAQYCADGVSFHKNGMEYPLGFPEKDGVFALISDIPQALKNPFALTINGKVYDGSSAVSITTETITEHDFVRFWHDGIEIQNDGSEHVLRFSDFDTELEEFSPHISCQYDGPQYYWVWKFPQISGTFAMESQIPTKLSQLTNDGNYQTNTSDLKDNTTTFTTASERSNVASGEKLSVSFGKISKYFNDLKAVAFSGNKSDIGLGNVDNTSDANKPVSNATQQALNLKANASDVYSKTETDGLLNNKANKTETDNGINKSLYNLGAYDTITANADGTYTITRQTGYLNANNLNWQTDSSSNGYYRYYSYVDISTSGNSGSQTFISNIAKTSYIEPSKNGIDLQKTSDGKIFVGYASTSSMTSAQINALNIYIEYELSTSYTEKVEANHYARYNKRFILEHNKSEAERSANLLDNSLLNKNAGSDNFTANRLPFVLEAGTYTISLNGSTTSITIALQNASGADIFTPVTFDNYITQTFTISEKSSKLVLYNVAWTNANYNIMLNEGSVALPYQPYNQNKHITNNEADFLKTEHDRSANLFNNTTNYSATNNGVSINVVGNECILNGTSTEGFFKILGTTTLKAGTYTFNQVILSGSINGNMEHVKFGLYKYDAFFPLNVYKGTYTLTQDTSVDIVVWFNQAGITFNNCKLAYMLNEGSVALPYQPYEGKVVHEKELGDTLGGYVTTNTEQTITGYKKYNSIGIDTINGATLGNAILRQNTSSGDVIVGSTVRPLRLWGNQIRPSYSKNDGASYSEIALMSDIPTFKTINGNSIVGSSSEDISITPGIFTKLGNKTNFSFDSGSYLVVANNGMVTVTGTDPLNVGSSANKKFVGIFMVTIAEYGGGQSVCVNTEEVFSGEAASATISGPMFTIYRLN